jgi:regulator of protease activity HflC (stomatin/prohibitin superfamily)
MDILIIIGVLALVIFFFGVVTVQQGNIAVISMFGKYSRILYPGLNFKIPQANVYFKSMLLYSVINQEEKTIINVAYKFIDAQSLMQTIVRTVEGSIRSFVATKKQSEILSLRKEIVSYVKDQIDQVMEEWGYHLQDLQLNDITFDEVILKSMSQVVASNNLKAAAENEGQALLITKTKAAEAEGNAIKISANAEKEAAKLRGQGVALFRQEVAKGMSDAAREMQQANLDTSVILFSMWTEAIKQFGEQSNGNVIFLDGSPDNMQRTMQQMMSVNQLDTLKKTNNASKKG